jgi:hypothetical protein
VERTAAIDFDSILACNGAEQPSVIDEIEPVESTNEYREASRRMLAFLFSIIEFLSSYENPKQLETRFWSVALSLQHPCCEGMPALEFAQMLEQTRANLSKHITTFERLNDLQPTLGQKGARRGSYLLTRMVPATKPAILVR